MAPSPIVIDDRNWLGVLTGTFDMIVIPKRDYTVFRPRNEGYFIASYYPEDCLLSFYVHEKDRPIPARIKNKCRLYFENQGNLISKVEVV